MIATISYLTGTLISKVDHREAVSDAFRSALENDDIKVILFSGKWGTGKTFMWDSFAKEFMKKQIPQKFKMYSYISLFGLEDISDIKSAIASDWIFTSNSDQPENWYSKYKPSWLKDRKTIKAIVNNIPLLEKNYDAGMDIALSKLTDSVICIDDLERRSSKFELLPVLGFAERLATKQSCKVILISNTGSLDDKEQSLLETYHEKVIDRAIEFTPQSSNNAKLICDGTEIFDSDLCEVMDKLEVTNLRIIKHIRAYTRELLDACDASFSGLTSLIATSVTLIANVHYNREDNIPDIEFLRGGHLRAKLSVYKDVEVSDNHKEWVSYLERISWGTFNAFDETIYDFIRTGILPRSKFVDAADQMRLEYESDEVRSDTTRVWNLYYETFDNNEEYFLDTLFSTYKKHINETSVNNINAAITVLRDYGRENSANILCELWVDEMLEHESEKLDIKNLYWASDLTDATLRSAMVDAHSRSIEKIKLSDVFLLIDKGDALTRDTEIVFAKSYSSDIEGELRGTRSSNVFKKARSLLRYSKFVDNSIGGNANELKVLSALKSIGNGSAINAKRVAVILSGDDC